MITLPSTLPSPEDIRGTWGNDLANKKIFHCITGSISAYRAPDLARTLIRFGADVYPVMSEMATSIIHPYTMRWATGREPILKMSGRLEHLEPVYENADLVLIAPATANMIGKIANGVADDVVSTLALVALGSNIPILIVPAMHQEMFNSPTFKRNLETLREIGVEVIEPLMSEGKAKLPDIMEITDYVIKKLTPNDLNGKHVAITAGPTLEQIDPIRVITNRSSGKMGVEIAKNAWYRGAKVTLLYGRGTVNPPRYIRTIRVETTEEMYEATINLLEKEKIDIFIGAAAAADYKPAESYESKIRSEDLKTLSIKLVSTPKIINSVKEKSKEIFLVAFKAEYNVSEDELIERGYRKIEESKADMVVINDVSRRDIGFQSDYNEVIIVDKQRNIIRTPKLPKREIARIIIDEIIKRIKG